MLSCFFFSFHALLSQKVCLLTLIFIAIYLCRIRFYLFFVYLRYSKIHLFQILELFLSPQICAWNLNRKLFVVEQSWALRNFTSGPTDRDLVTKMSKGPFSMEVPLTIPGPRGSIWCRVLKGAGHSAPKEHWGCSISPQLSPPLAIPYSTQSALLYHLRDSEC